MSEKSTRRIAEAYGNHSQEYAVILEPLLTPLATEIVALADLQGYERILDLATGIGLVARAAAVSADAIGLDVSSGALRQAQQSSTEEIPWVTGDVHLLPFRDAFFDVVTCSISLSHFSNVTQALFEARRVLRPDGRLITSAWGSAGRNRTKNAANKVRDKYLSDREVTYGYSFSDTLWANPERGRETLQEAGFSKVQVYTKFLSGEYRDHAQAHETALAWPITRYRIERLDPETRANLVAEMKEALVEVDDLSWQSEVLYYQAVNF